MLFRNQLLFHPQKLPLFQFLVLPLYLYPILNPSQLPNLFLLPHLHLLLQSPSPSNSIPASTTPSPSNSIPASSSPSQSPSPSNSIPASSTPTASTTRTGSVSPSPSVSISAS